MRSVDAIAARLAELGVRHVFGVSGANIEDLFAAIQRRRPELSAYLAKHEHSAGTAADAYARLTGGLGVVMCTSGGAAMNLASALAESYASRVPVLAIVGEPPSDVQGRGAFQDTSGRGGAVDAAAVHRAVSKWCARVDDVEALPRMLEDAIAAALSDPPGPAVLLISKDRQERELRARTIATVHMGQPHVVDEAALSLARAALEKKRAVIIAGDQIARSGATSALASFAEAIDARVAVAPDARDAFDNFDPRFLGVAGAMGHAPVANALRDAELCILAGTRLPLLARLGLEAILCEKPVVSFGRGAPYFAFSALIHLEGDPAAILRVLGFEARVAESSSRTELEVATVMAAVEASLDEGSVLLADAGNTGASAVHDVRLPRGARFLIAMGMAGMGYTFGAAIGAALATGRRATVLAGDGAFFMHGMEIHTAVEHRLPITYVLFNNRAHGMCLVREQLLLGETHGHNEFRASHLGAGLAAMFPTLPSCDCRTPAELLRALAIAKSREGPSVIALELPEVEVPPFIAFQGRKKS